MYCAHLAHLRQAVGVVFGVARSVLCGWLPCSQVDVFSALVQNLIHGFLG